MANELMDIQNTMRAKNTQMSRMGAPQTQQPQASQVNTAGLDQIAASPNSTATPQRNAAELDIMAGIVKAKFYEYDQIMAGMIQKFGAILPELDKLKQEHDAIMQALQAAQGGPAASQVAPQGNNNGVGV